MAVVTMWRLWLRAIFAGRCQVLVLRKEIVAAQLQVGKRTLTWKAEA